ncbi:Glucoamylase [Commensalibacter sp. Nvir]|uniref:glycoside hydrolase family 15 protein n=1 Tax=Commensalibacter sp. Nvir TaxID=3069817 RepID=UPI002D6815C1|nr:Glucoamylase [Commensalibacter sp. Nvir]
MVKEAPGGPGLPSTWTSSAKDIIGTSIYRGRVWYAVGYGILNEVYWPSCSIPQIRDIGFIVSGENFWSEVKRNHNYELTTPEAGLLLPHITHTHKNYKLELEIVPDPVRDVLLIHYKLIGHGLKLYTLLAPHLGGDGDDNYGKITPEGLVAYKQLQHTILSAEHGFNRGSVGYIGTSDGWCDFHENKKMTWHYDQAGPGNIALIGELNENEGVLALAFCYSIEGVRTLAYSSLSAGYEEIKDFYIKSWKAWFERILTPTLDYLPERFLKIVKLSAAVIKCHTGGTFPGALIASLSTPWGDSHKDTGGYHLVWPRDTVEVAFAMLACDMIIEAKSVLAYLISIQQPDGHWLQNNYTDGRPYWLGLQLDEVALPVLLAAKLSEMNLLGSMYNPAKRMAQKALRFIAQHGPTSPQDRWEENSGLNPFTLAVSITALVSGARLGFLEERDQQYALDLASDWNNRLESWVYVKHTNLDKEHQIEGHYIRLNPSCHSARYGKVMLKNRNNQVVKIRNLLGMEYLYLVRLGLRQGSDKKIRDTTKLIDKLLCVQLPAGPYYYRYNNDGYGEHDDGSPYDGNGKGRLWPLLSGERGHYAIECKESVLPYLNAILASASIGGMLPEQVWDNEDIPERHLYKGKATGSAMPLIWAHAELIKLIYTYKTQVPIERLQCVVQYFSNPPQSPKTTFWNDTVACNHTSCQNKLWIQASQPFTLRYGLNNWQNTQEISSQLLGLGIYGASIDIKNLAGQKIDFTRKFLDQWEEKNWHILIEN